MGTRHSNRGRGSSSTLPSKASNYVLTIQRSTCSETPLPLTGLVHVKLQRQESEGELDLGKMEQRKTYDLKTINLEALCAAHHGASENGSHRIRVRCCQAWWPQGTLWVHRLCEKLAWGNCKAHENYSQNCRVRGVTESPFSQLWLWTCRDWQDGSAGERARC